MIRSKRVLGAALGGVLWVAACSDEGEETATDAATTATTTTSASATSSSGAGGAGTGGGGGAGADGCLDGSGHDAYFGIADSGLCVVATYDLPTTLGYDADAAFYFRAATWGTHDGPLTLDPGQDGAIDVVRWAVPDAPTGALTKGSTTVPAAFPADGFLGAQALDLPFFGWTTISWTGAFPMTEGELVAVDATAKTTAFPVNGIYGSAALGSATEGRVVHTGLSVLGDTTLGENGLYAADSCGSGATASLVPDGDAGCGAPILVAAWGDASGPVTADASGNVFAVLTAFDGTQEARGFATSTIARGAAPTEGTTAFTLPGFGSSLAAMAPTADAPGWLFFQPNDASDPYDALDVVAVPYTSDGDVIGIDAEPAPALTLTIPNTPLAMFTDALGRLWVGVAAAAGQTKLFVIDRVPVAE